MIVRADYNVPTKGTKILDTRRIEASYTMAEEVEDPTTVTRRSQERANKQEPVIKGVLPDAPAPVVAPKPEPMAAAVQPVAKAPVVAAAPVAPAEKGFFGWIKGLFGGGSTPAPAPVAAPEPVAPTAAGKDERREGRNGRDGDLNAGRLAERGPPFEKLAGTNLAIVAPHLDLGQGVEHSLVEVIAIRLLRVENRRVCFDLPLAGKVRLRTRKHELASDANRAAWKNGTVCKWPHCRACRQMNRRLEVVSRARIIDASMTATHKSSNARLTLRNASSEKDNGRHTRSA